MRKRALVVTIVAATWLAPHAALAANKEQQQLMAELRMLQEQQQQLQQMLGGLTDTLKVITARLDDQSGATRKLFADQNLLIQNVAETTRILREKADDTNVRLSTMTQEVQALRQTVASLPPPGAVGSAMPGGEPMSGDPAAPPSTTAPPTTAPPPNVSPTAMWDRVYADYAAGQWDLAIEGFQAFIRTFPTSPNADEAQLNIGNSYYNAGRFQEAIPAYQKVISDYPKDDMVPAAWFKLGSTYERLKQQDLARRAYETVTKDYPGTQEATLARTRLDSMR